MLIELVAAVALGFAAAGLALLARRAVPSLPRFTVPAVAGLAMIGFGIWSEYTWFDRTSATLPDGIEVISAPAESAVWRPWSYVTPLVLRFMAVDLVGARRNEAAPGQVIVEAYVIGRHGPRARIPVLLDCVGLRRADIADGIDFAPDGTIAEGDWRPAAPDDPLIAAVCGTS
ncbi:hypothetical protein [Algihabitans albus]|uniref:hypothetical protein n=1 Tax=Algihabitans albus TaxID=2164067 RepID=UPI000E5D8F5A|nr:hypothetical protein [Algihabitans albus]